MLTIVAMLLTTLAAENPAPDKDADGGWIQFVVAVREPAPGLWKLMYGHEINLDDPTSLIRDRSVLTIEGDKLTFRNGDHKKALKVELDPSKSPKTIDLIADDGTRYLGVYEVKEGKLHLAIGNTKERPEEVEVKKVGGGDGKIVRITYSKLKAAK